MSHERSKSDESGPVVAGLEATIAAPSSAGDAATDQTLVQPGRGSPGASELRELPTVDPQHYRHPSIISIHDAGRWPSGTAFYTMKRVDGRAFNKVISRAPSPRDVAF